MKTLNSYVYQLHFAKIDPHVLQLHTVFDHANLQKKFARVRVSLPNVMGKIHISHNSHKPNICLMQLAICYFISIVRFFGENFTNNFI